MFDLINQAMFYLLEGLKTMTGSYGMAIVAITILIRVVLWPVNSAQTRSMKKMQELQPKIKQLQERFKDNPQKMQEAMLKFYQENKFNPLAGCLPILIQIPIFFGLYGVLNSPDFLAHVGNEKFLFIHKLTNTLQSHAGESNDNAFNVQVGDHFATGQVAHLRFKDGRELEYRIANPAAALHAIPNPLIPGEPLTMWLDLGQVGLSPDYVRRLASVQTSVVNEKSREIETLAFTPRGPRHLVHDLQTLPGQNRLHVDVLILILLYGALTLLYQKLMQKGTADAMGDATQAQLMKMMPLMFVVMMFLIPIPAGVMLYLLVTMVLMYVQTLWVHWREDRQADGHPRPRPASQIIDVKPE